MTLHLQDLLGAALGRKVRIQGERSCGGGCISDARKVKTDHGDFFVKSGPPEQTGLLQAELDGLSAIATVGTVRCPKPWGMASDERGALLALEWLDLASRSDSRAMERLGRDLARFHLAFGESFGWDRDNFIGSTPQDNTPDTDWARFFAGRRIEPLLERVAGDGFSFSGAAKFLERIGTILSGHHPKPSPLHGDLWAGNAASTTQGEPVIFDPSFYYGDAEVDLAMTRMFGGFPAGFYEAYAEVHPLPEGHRERVDLYNLYHYLNHTHLFGGSYASGCRRIIDRFL